MENQQLVTVIHDNQSIQLHINRMAIYHVCTIIEAVNAESECFYLFFYKNQFLTGRKASQLNRQSRIETVFKQGIVFHFPHPLIKALLTKNQPFIFQNFNQLLKNVQRQYSPQETMMIFSFFDSFIQKEKLIKLMTNSFYQYRRNGQLFLAYRIIRILRDFAPESKLAQEICNHIQYLKYAKLYDLPDQTLQEKDPLYAEQLHFQQRENERFFSLLQTSLTKEDRWIDMAALYIDQFIQSKEPDTDAYHVLFSFLSRHFSEEETSDLLQDLCTRGPVFPQLREDLFDLWMNLQRYNEAVQLLAEQQAPLTPSQYEQLIDALENSSLASDRLHIEKMNALLIYQTHPEKLEKLLRLCIPLLLRKYDLTFVKEWVQPFERLNFALPTVQKVKKMVEMTEDPDQQLGLGKLYYQMNQLEKAVECFSWEMELKPTDPVPVQWLTKVYRELGMIEESKAYEYMYSNMQKYA
ncbi:hypothetical protein ACFOU2_21860 [Bacillus songklensis]|uniref:Tetratricopeptide repeat protein n=1 Tax=Bacillus songklensis TaxID=1069116 RepID=A0ABV8B988_9BACI